MITLKQALFANLQRRDDPKQGLLDAVQAAVQLEHATLPPYLYALYSLDPEKNGVIAELIRSVLMEEMLHIALAANLLNALGGEPRIASFDTAPRYPGPLPGGVEHELIVHLAPFSDSQLDTFLQIEAPENILEFRVARGAVAGEQPPRTIGQFYRGILVAFASSLTLASTSSAGTLRGNSSRRRWMASSGSATWRPRARR